MSHYRSRQRKSYEGYERRATRVYWHYMVLTIIGLGAIAFATLCPIEMRPHLGSAIQERFGAYFVLGLLAVLAVPRQQTVISLSIVAIAFGLEAAQRLVPTRDAAIPDAIVKAFGGMLGAQCGVMTFAARRRLKQAYRRHMESMRSRSRSEGRSSRGPAAYRARS